MSDNQIIRLHQENIQVDKKTVVTGSVMVELNTVFEDVEVDIPLTSTHTDVHVVAVNEIVDTVPDIRTDGDTIIIPIIEEVMVKRILVKEEVRIQLSQSISQHKEVVRLRKQVATITRKDRTDAN